MPANPAEQAPFVLNPKEAQALPPANQWLAPNILQGFGNLENMFAQTETKAFIVLRGDTVIYERYFDEHRPETPLTVFSVTKAYTAALTSIAVQEGYMRLDQSIADFIPEFRNDARKEITIQHLLNMTEGLNWMDYKNVFWLGILYYASDENRFVINHTALRFKPGTHFAYKSITTHILGMCIEAATNRRLSDYMNEKLWQPLQMPHDGLFTMDSRKARHNRALGGMAITARSMLHFGKMLLDGGKWKGKQVLSEDFVKSISERNIYLDKWWGYSNCFWLNSYLDRNYLDMQDFHAAGYNGQFIFVSPESNTVIVRVGAANGKIDWSSTLGRLSALLGGRGNDLTAPIRYDFSNQFEGVYETNRSEKLVVVDKGVNDKGARIFTVFKDKDRTVKLEKMLDMSQSDGRSVVQYKFSRQHRLMFEEFAGEVVGAYHDDLLSIDSKYFKKTSNQLPDKYRRMSVNFKK